jgi:hypothetical protein
VPYQAPLHLIVASTKWLKVASMTRYESKFNVYMDNEDILASFAEREMPFDIVHNSLRDGLFVHQWHSMPCWVGENWRE